VKRAIRPVDDAMSDSFDLRAEVDALQDLSNYEISNEHDILSMSTGQVNNLLDRESESWRYTYKMIDVLTLL
jgi:hypothetical protein